MLSKGVRHHIYTSLAPALAAALVLCLATDAVAQDPPPAIPQEHIGATPFTMQGFGDINYLAGVPEPGRSGFVNGALDLFATSRLGDHWSALAELVFETDGNALATDLERFQFTYEYSDAFRLSAGRMHNPFLRWPIVNHHGLFNQTSVDRPIIARWEDSPGLWPMHFVGLMAQGRFADAIGFSYSLGVGNGRGHILDEIQVGADENDNRALLASAGVSPASTPGLELYVATYLDRIPSVTGTLRERDVTASGAYVRGDIEMRAEWSRMNHTDVGTSVTYHTTGWYVLAAYRLAERLGRIKPYLLVEKLDVDEHEAFLEGAPDEDAWALGLRWDANRWVALKADYWSRRLAGADRDGVVRAQLAVSF